MTLNEFLKYVETRKPLKGDEIHQFMNKMSDEARRMTFRVKRLISRSPRKSVSCYPACLISRSIRLFVYSPRSIRISGKNITVGKNVFINACCHFQDHGGGDTG